ncbi:hypothetical protein [Pelotalea chapellei]|uniref:DUF4124 domain-containing protein n=1 Tax=Pelotalea chapellei TaxID=44671 RepID=A0ABS5U3W2_9BACT|nr:hypothetical protein [Pelotalea chapellei]MBT1070347.1 hypothetical protein [Pelotalea chapellei]
MKRMFTAVVICAVFATVSVSYGKSWRWQGNQQNTYGWQLMTPEERTEHQNKLRSFKDFGACKEYIDEHHKQMEERAKERGITPPVMKRNPCETMKSKSMLK